MIAAIAGGRNYYFDQEDYLWLDTLHKKHRITTVLTGGATGADECATFWAYRRGIPIQTYPADWKQHGRAAGPLRNAMMMQHAKMLIVFPGGTGTRNIIGIARGKNVRVESREVTHRY